MNYQYLLDTNICIYIAKERPISVLNKFEKLAVGKVGMSIITYGELFYGVEKSLQIQKNLTQLEELSLIIPPIPLSVEVGKCYGEIRSKLEKQGKLIGSNDLWIAAHAISLNLKLVTNNVKEFSRISHLKVENWV